MRLLRFVVLLGVVGVIVSSTSARFVTASPVREVAIVKIAAPLQIRGILLHGTYVFDHDTGRMTRGEPCTAIYEFTEEGIGKCVLRFHCLPRQTGAVGRFTLTTRRSPDPAFPPRLLEYQFAGSGEAHGIPKR
ncbi:MAG: hypothetical protein HY654_10740 [Acidobacteria bacterium]|nr:hypothetical protein [Acidobacteriota bacterium]